MKKRITALMILMAMLLTLPACSKAPVTQPDSANQPADTTPADDVPSDDAPSDDTPASSDAPAPDAPAPGETGDSEADADIPPEYAGRTVITLATMYDSVFWDQSDVSLGGQIRLFNEAQDEFYLRTKSYVDSSDPTELRTEDRVYADIINGDRADLYYTGMFDLTSEKLSNAGLIQDWYSVMDADPDFHMEDYLTHIWEALEAPGGELYDLCAGYGIQSMLSGPKELLDGLENCTYDEFLAFLDENDITITQTYYLDCTRCYMDWIDRETLTCDFQSESFYDWLHFVAALPTESDPDQEQLSHYVQGLIRHKSEGEKAGYWRRYLALPSRYPHSPFIFPTFSFALSSTTEHPDACMAFVKFLLSYDNQMYYYGKYVCGFPLNRQVWEDMLERIQLNGDDENALDSGKGYSLKLVDGEPVITYYDWKVGLPAEEAAYLRRLVDSLDQCYQIWGDTYSIFYEEVNTFLHGDITDEQCAERLQQRFTIFLSERQ